MTIPLSQLSCKPISVPIYCINIELAVWTTLLSLDINSSFHFLANALHSWGNYTHNGNKNGDLKNLLNCLDWSIDQLVQMIGFDENHFVRVSSPDTALQRTYIGGLWVVGLRLPHFSTIIPLTFCSCSCRAQRYIGSWCPIKQVMSPFSFYLST